MQNGRGAFRGLVSVLCAMALAFVLASTALGQSSLGSVRGSVRDQTGAVIPSAKLDLVNKATNVEMHAETNESGQYVFPAVLPGNYTMTVASAGMETLQVALEVQVQVSTNYNAVLKPGATETKITVSAELTPLTTTDSPTLGHVLETQRIAMLPLNGRDIQQLVVTVPGLELAIAGTNQVRSFGMMSGAHQYILDGAVLEESMWQESTVIRPPGIETIQEFKVENNASSAKFTRMTNIIMSTKSGTNQLHGSGFEANRDNYYGKSRSRTDFAPTFPQLHRNEYGGTIGGPVWIPKVYNGKNRTFFFFSYEGFRVDTPSSFSSSVPTAAMRAGDFSGLIDSQARLTTIYNPFTTDATTWARQPFSYGGKLNAIDPSLQTPLSKYLYNVSIQKPSAGYENANPVVSTNWYGYAPNNTKEVTNTYRIDHRFSDKDSIYARYNHAPHTKFYQVECIPSADNIACTANDKAINTSGVLNWVHQITPTFFNEAMFTVATTWRDRITGDGKTSYADQFGLPNAFSQVGFPYIQDLSSFLGGSASSNVRPYNHNKFTFGFPILDDNATKIEGKHELQFGFHIRRDRLNTLPQQVFYTGITSFATGATTLYDPLSGRVNPSGTSLTGSNAANSYIGVANYQNDLRKGTFKIRRNEEALYFQDNFKVTQRLTLNLGLRWQFTPFMSEASGIPIPGFDKANHAIVFSQPLANLYSRGITYPSIIGAYQNIGVKFETYNQVPGLPQKMGYDYWKDWSPHLGFAYRVGDGAKSFVIRGGYSKSYFYEGFWTWLDQSAAATPLSASFNKSVTDATQAPDGLSGYGMRSVPTIIASVNSKNAITLNNPVGITPGSTYNYFFNPNQPTAYVQDWNLTLEKDIKGNSMIRLGYVGNHGGNQMESYDFNTGPPAYVWYMTQRVPLPTGTYANTATRPYDQTTYGTLQEYVKGGWSNYNGIQATFERRYSHGYGFQVWYVLGNAFRAGGSDSGGGYASQVNAASIYMPGRVPADYYSRDRFLNYRRDTADEPKHRVRWNYVVDLPFGRGKPLAKNAGRIAQGVIGGWQLSSMGTIWSTYASLGTNFNLTGEPIHFYGYDHPIMDCTSVSGATSGQCYPGYLFANGYLPANKINSVDPATGRPNGYEGIPADYKPYATPLITWGQTTAPANMPAGTTLSQYWDTNNIWIPLNTGAVQRVSYGELAPLRQQYYMGPWQWNQDASLFKSFVIREGMALRFNLDAFNVTNHPNNNGPGGSGLLSTQGQSNAARQLQLAIRVTW